MLAKKLTSRQNYKNGPITKDIQFIQCYTERYPKPFSFIDDKIRFEVNLATFPRKSSVQESSQGKNFDYFS